MSIKIYDEECFAANAAGIDVSQGKSMVSVLRPFNKTSAKPFEVHHISSELKQLADGRRPEKKLLDLRTKQGTPYLSEKRNGDVLISGRSFSSLVSSIRQPIKCFFK